MNYIDVNEELKYCYCKKQLQERFISCSKECSEKLEKDMGRKK